MNKMVIWLDLDGVIFDSYEVWDQVVQGILKHHGVAYTQQIREELWRIPMEDVNAYLLQFVENSLDENELERQKMNQLQSLYRDISLVEGVHELLSTLKAKGAVIYAVTSNYLELAELGLSSHHLSNYFVKLYSSLDLFGSDKNREFYQFILHQERIDPANIVMVEDNKNNLCIGYELGIAGVYIEHPNSPFSVENTGIVSIKQLSELIPILEDKK
ncbi:HAD family hydrolase [Streptococcus parasuis]|uniref:HAD family hydrolase n=1 Tax=Streptococcus parasuis TaxID=1501662 RepID=UPI001C2B9665|nr:HAD hydrolase-like protein [Streptococcus parasuis]MBV1943989.1 HAD family hydrolase [Streptococcus parasuis]QXF06226.1 HAD family hydrolase [Streptococcus parasuis]